MHQRAGYGMIRSVPLPSARRDRRWRFVYNGAVVVAFGIVSVLTFGSHDRLGWALVVFGAAMMSGGLVAIRRRS